MKKNLLPLEQQRVAVIKEDWLHCKRCALHEEREPRKIVFGVGSPGVADFLFVYETPTEVDVLSEEPLCGMEGEVLLDIWQQAKVPAERAYCLPLVACRPTSHLAATDTQAEKIVDREPSKVEIASCFPRVQKMVYALDPRVIFAMGDIAWKTLVQGKDRGSYTTVRDAVKDQFIARIPGVYGDVRYDVFPLPSIQQILKAPSAAEHGLIALTVRQLLNAVALVDYSKKAERSDKRKADELQQGKGSE